MGINVLNCLTRSAQRCARDRELTERAVSPPGQHPSESVDTRRTRSLADRRPSSRPRTAKSGPLATVPADAGLDENDDPSGPRW